MIIAMLAAWVLGGLLLALLVGGAVRIADHRYQLTATVLTAPALPAEGRTSVAA